jgi:hypothetical protein
MVLLLTEFEMVESFIFLLNNGFWQFRLNTQKSRIQMGRMLFRPKPVKMDFQLADDTIDQKYKFGSV